MKIINPRRGSLLKVETAQILRCGEVGDRGCVMSYELNSRACAMPTSCFLLLASMSVRECHSCGARADVRCGRCKASTYCTLACQKDHWPEHKTVCAAITETYPSHVSAKFDLLVPVRTLLRHYDGTRVLGSGAHGIVLLANDITSVSVAHPAGEEVALKVQRGQVVTASFDATSSTAVEFRLQAHLTTTWLASTVNAGHTRRTAVMPVVVEYEHFFVFSTYDTLLRRLLSHNVDELREAQEAVVVANAPPEAQRDIERQARIARAAASPQEAVVEKARLGALFRQHGADVMLRPQLFGVSAMEVARGELIDSARILDFMQSPRFTMHMAQVLAVFHVLSEALGVTHFDAHTHNMLETAVPLASVLRCRLSSDAVLYVATYGALAKLGDFGLATAHGISLFSQFAYPPAFYNSASGAITEPNPSYDLQRFSTSVVEAFLAATAGMAPDALAAIVAHPLVRDSLRIVHEMVRNDAVNVLDQQPASVDKATALQVAVESHQLLETTLRAAVERTTPMTAMLDISQFRADLAAGVAGCRHFAFRHVANKSPTARRVFMNVPALRALVARADEPTGDVFTGVSVVDVTLDTPMASAAALSAWFPVQAMSAAAI